MDLVLMSLLTALGIFAGIYAGATFGESGSNREAYNTGYENGYQKAVSETKDFPTTLDGKFYSTEAAIRSLSMKESDK